MLRTFLLISPMLMMGLINAAESRTINDIVAEKCIICHGEEGEGSSAYPRLAGQHAEYIAKQLADFKSGRRESTTMVEMVTDLTEEEMLALGKFYSDKPSVAHKVRNKDLSAVGYYIYHRGNKYTNVPACESCHGAEGKGTEKLPRLAGQHKHYLSWQLKDFNERKRTNDNAIMHSIASKLTELEIDAVSLYISGME